MSVKKKLSKALKPGKRSPEKRHLIPTHIATFVEHGQEDGDYMYLFEDQVMLTVELLREAAVEFFTISELSHTVARGQFDIEGNPVL